MDFPHIVRQSAEFIGEQREVRQVFVIGSVSHQRSDQHSDIDLLALGNARPSASARLRHYRKILPRSRAFHTFNLRSWEFGTSDSFVFCGTPLCIMYYTKADLGEKIQEVMKGNGEPRGFYHPTGFLSALASATLIESASAERDCSGFSYLNNFPQPLLQQVNRRCRLQLNYFLQASKIGLLREDYFYTQQCLFHLREAVLSLTFALARRYRVSDKRIGAELKKCEAAVPVCLMALATKMFALTDFAPASMGSTVEQLAPLVANIEAALWR